MLTRSDFGLIAYIIRTHGPAILETGRVRTTEVGQRAMAETFADYLAPTNARFDRAKFIAAAMGKEQLRPLPGQTGRGENVR